MKNITIDIINDKALKLLQQLEDLHLIRVHRSKATNTQWSTKYKGAMKKQSLAEIDAQLNSLRQEWE